MILKKMMVRGARFRLGISMPKLRDLTGLRFGRLLVVRRGLNRGRHVMWECRCDCGGGIDCEVRSSSLVSGNTRSCGCLLGEWNNEQRGLPRRRLDGDVMPWMERISDGSVVCCKLDGKGNKC